jgi:hypothetical protein
MLVIITKIIRGQDALSDHLSNELWWFDAATREGGEEQTI